MTILIIVLLSVAVMACAFFLLVHRFGIRSAYYTFALIILAATVISLASEKKVFSGFLLLETAVLGLFLLLGGVALITNSLKRNQHWRILLLATSVVGLSFAVTCVEIYRIALQVSAL